MSDVSVRILRLQEKIVSKEKKISETKGEIISLKKQLKDHDVSSVEEAKSKLKEIEKEIEECEAKILKKLNSVEHLL